LTSIKEIWKPVVEFPDYEVSNYGQILHVHRGILKQSACESKKGSGGWGPFMGVSLGGSRKRVHRVVARAHVELPFKVDDVELIDFLYDVLWVLHRDGNWKNNQADNLRWGTPKENAADTKKHRALKELGLPLTLPEVPSVYNELF
jgi:hypothetical protein